MMSIWGAERSTYHGTCVRRVRVYLSHKCDKAGAEKQLVPERITDAAGYDSKRKTWYLCEIKVNRTDLQKALLQIYDTASRFYSPKNPRYHRGDTVVPVIALPGRLQKELVQHHNWDSLCDSCKKLGVAIWVIEQSTIREVTRRKTKVAKTKTKAVKANQSKTKSAKTKTAIAKAAKSRLRTVKSTKARQIKAKNTKRSSERKSTVKARESSPAPKKKRS